MMEDLVKLVSERVGISKENATHAVKTVVVALKERLPGPVASQLEGLLDPDHAKQVVSDLKTGIKEKVGKVSELIGKK